MVNEDVLRYPIGKFYYSRETSWEELQEAIKHIAVLPSWLSQTVSEIPEEQLNNTYREGGWTIRQIIHHLADSHMNAYIRFRLALTEYKPIIKPYNENLWAELPDARTGEIYTSMEIIEGLHARWTLLMEHMEENDFKKEFLHPEHYRLISLGECVCQYSWHGRHHLKHIQNALEVHV